MPVINASGQEVENPWQSASDVSEDAIQDFAVLSTDSLKVELNPESRNGPKNLGVRMEVDDSVEDITAYLPHLGLIELVFPHFKDGRLYSTAVELRRKYGFSGDLRASGDILPDQALFFIRCGFSSLSVPGQFSAQQFKTALSAYSVAYQSGQGDTLPLIVGMRAPEPKAAAQ